MMELPKANDIAESALIGRDVVVGQGVRVLAGAIVGDGTMLGADSYIGAGAVLDAGSCSEIIRIEEGVQVQAAATIAAAVTVGREAIIQAGAVVTRAVPPYAIVSGNPAQIVGYTTTPATETELQPSPAPPSHPGRLDTQVKGVTISRLAKVIDLRGNLTVGEFERSVPFAAKRYFMVFGVPNAEIRGEHAHRTCHQFLVAAHGSCSVVADDGFTRQEFLLDGPEIGLHLPPLTWGIQYKYSPDAVLLVFASEYYDAQEYIRDYSEFVQLSRKVRGA
ncbi:WxcM-like domain-containing protein [Pseudoxanthomonas sp. CF125]|uniref:WxcM-like domain-containing protein n=1 Tax=Pseudoxanthomonas sp. CF125 TaxID=1855303 RepID=UPI00087F8CF3|nr:WxcM-like domain-containing protein [Pseudoxanthomonas sp. CF125]SDQ88874.1 transferase hexapeptide (six repeat-containing protein) [Pseudoxanthomonas sp. CF125]